MKKQYDIAAFVWPAYTGDEPRTRMFWPEGMGEWQSVKNAKAKCEGHTWPRRPLWGYVNEADPYVMEMQIACALRHGVNVFIYDWYWYDNRPFLENCLNDGFLKAANNEQMRFYLMWANHDATNLWNISVSDSHPNEVLWKGAVGMDIFRNLVDRWIRNYFSRPNYYRIDGKPVFMLYDLRKFEEGFGGREGAKQAVEYFRTEVEKAGFPGLHLQLVTWGAPGYATYEYKGLNAAEDDEPLAEFLGFDSMTHYQWVSMVNANRDYAEILPDIRKEFERMEKQKIPFFPHVSLGWDNNPRFQKLKLPIVKNNTPDQIEKALRMAKDYADSHDLPAPLITVNSWNEWTETSYLQPDDIYGYGYLEAVRKVFLEE